MTDHWARHIQSVAFDTNKQNIMIQISFFVIRPTNNEIVLVVIFIEFSVYETVALGFASRTRMIK